MFVKFCKSLCLQHFRRIFLNKNKSRNFTKQYKTYHNFTEIYNTLQFSKMKKNFYTTFTNQKNKDFYKTLQTSTTSDNIYKNEQHCTKQYKFVHNSLINFHNHVQHCTKNYKTLPHSTQLYTTLQKSSQFYSTSLHNLTLVFPTFSQDFANTKETSQNLHSLT